MLEFWLASRIAPMTRNRAGVVGRRIGYSRTFAILRQWRVLVASVVATIAMVGYVVGIDAGSRALGLHTSGAGLALVLGAGLASIPWALWTIALGMGGGATWLAGSVAEEWTAKELGRLGSRWWVTHNLQFEESSFGWSTTVDVDHVAVGPYGILVVETKWTSSTLDLASPQVPSLVIEAVHQTTRNAGRIRALLARDVGEVPLIAVVVWWGPHVKPPSGALRSIEGVRVVRGVDAPSWRARIQSAADRVDSELGAAVVKRIERFKSASHHRPG